VNTNVVSETAKRNADLADDINSVNYFNNGSRIIMGLANGRTVLDTLADSANSYLNMQDLFIARITSKGEAKWFKRFHSTFGSGNLLKVTMRGDKAYFLINYNIPINDSNYIVL
jgi:hypothetical protein